MIDPSTPTSVLWRDRFQRLLTHVRRVFPFASGMLAALGAFLLAEVVRADLDVWFEPDLAWAARGLDYFGLAMFVMATLFTLSTGVRYFRRYSDTVFAG